MTAKFISAKNNQKMNARGHYPELYQQSITDPGLFWSKQAEHYLTWFTPWTQTISGNFQQQDIHWFVGGQLNAAYNCLDKHLPLRAQQIALICEGNEMGMTKEYSYQALYDAVCRFANVLKQSGIKKGDRVGIYLPMIFESVVAMLACSRIGAIHCVVFAGFSAQALRSRIIAADCKTVITANESLRGHKVVPLKANVDQALNGIEIKKVFVVKNTNAQVSWQADRDVWFHEALTGVSVDCPPEPMASNDTLFLLYTSGSTGKPKGIMHATAGYLLHAACTFDYLFDHRDGDVFFCTGDIGWITGHTYTVYGPLLNGGTTVLFDGVITHPTPARIWDIIDKHQVNSFYTAPTAIRTLRREGDQWVQNSNRTSLRILGSVGEPINPEAWFWYHDVVGKKRCQVIDTWWQTETGGAMISTIPYLTKAKPGSAALPFFGVVPEIVDETEAPLPANTMGQLVIKQPWPGMMQNIYNDAARFKQYFTSINSVYLTGDQAYYDDDHFYWILGRNDDVIMVSGHRIGSEEVESALLTHPAVAESAVVGVQDEVKGQHIQAFVLLHKTIVESDILKTELVDRVREQIGPLAAPQAVYFVAELPKTRSGKIMRRILRHIAHGEVNDLGDLSTLADPQVVEQIIKGYRNVSN